MDLSIGGRQTVDYIFMDSCGTRLLVDVRGKSLYFFLFVFKHSFVIIVKIICVLRPLSSFVSTRVICTSMVTINDDKYKHRKREIL